MKLVRVQSKILYTLKDTLINRLARHTSSPVPLELYLLLLFPLEQGIADEILCRHMRKLDILKNSDKLIKQSWPTAVG